MLKVIIDIIPMMNKSHRSRIAFKGDKTPFIMNYKVKDLQDYQNRIMDALNYHIRNNPPYNQPLAMSVLFLLPRPATQFPKKHFGLVFPTKRPDLDNYQKALQDTLNKIVLIDDSIIVDLNLKKRYSWNTNPKIIIHLYKPKSPNMDLINIDNFTNLFHIPYDEENY